LAEVYQAQGDVEGALQVIGKAEQVARKHDYAYMNGAIAKLRVRLWVAQGKLAAASHWAEEHRWCLADELDLAREAEQTAVVRVWMARALSPGLDLASEIGRAQELLARLLAAAKESGRIGKAIELLALYALAFEIQGNRERALSTLKRALALGEPAGYVRTFVDEGKTMATLLRQAMSRDVYPSYAAQLLGAFGQETELSSPTMASLVEPLTEREVDVLRLIVAGLSNAEIAEELFIAMSTVKTHVNHIYGKLGVESRTQAVAKAREVGLL
jgi:LuxR family maltose regulon positive regulatory protein